LENTRQSGHFSEDLLEEYAFKRTVEPVLAQLEEHLLACVACRSRLAEIDGYIKVVKAATAGTQKKPPRSWAGSFGIRRHSS
jgi:hypothetical protein